jgi:hypothetical protein
MAVQHSEGGSDQVQRPSVNIWLVVRALVLVLGMLSVSSFVPGPKSPFAGGVDHVAAGALRLRRDIHGVCSWIAGDQSPLGGGMDQARLARESVLLEAAASVLPYVGVLLDRRRRWSDCADAYQTSCRTRAFASDCSRRRGSGWDQMLRAVVSEEVWLVMR